MFVKPIESQIEEAIQDIELNHHMYSRVMYNLEDGEVWTDVFVSRNEWNAYHNDKIILIYSGNEAPSYEYLYEYAMNTYMNTLWYTEIRRREQNTNRD